ncbi:MAG TPA: SH3 domain-containing protein [Chloroflexia bacterium]|nr:SH3 domain-containing protein [Chloroflexia bacterium]
MPINTPQPRLPLEPEEYPLYKPPSRVGCSGLTIVTLLLAVVFAFLIWKITPSMAKAITNIPRTLLGASSDATPGADGEAGAFPTQTSIVGAVPTETVAPAVPPTPVIEYVKVSGTGGSGVLLRAEPKTSAKYSVKVGEGATFKIIGPDVTNDTGTWRHVGLLPPDGRSGYVLSKYLLPTGAP